MRLTLFLAALLTCFGSPGAVLFAQDWFVSPAGDDVAGDGSEQNPFRSITRALQATRPGDTVKVAPGRYNQSNGEEFPMLVDGDVTVSGLPDEKEEAIVQTAVNKTLFVLGRGGARSARGAIENLRLEKQGSNPAVRAQGKGVTIRNNTIYAPGGAGVQVGNASSPLVSNCYVYDNRIYGDGVNNLDGIHAEQRGSSTALEVRGNLIVSMDNGVFFRSTDPRPRMELRDNRILDSERNGASLVAFDATHYSDFLVEGNTIAGSGGDGLAILFHTSSANSGPGEFSDGRVRYNSIHGNSGDGVDIRMSITHAATAATETTYLDASGIWIRFNEFRENGANGVLLDAEIPVWAAGADVLVPPLFGRLSPPSPGNHTFRDNGAYAFQVVSRDPLTGLVEAGGNWWGTTDPVELGARILDRLDEPQQTYGYEVRYDGPLADELEFTVTPQILRPRAGQEVVVRAEPGSHFAPYIGEIRSTCAWVASRSPHSRSTHLRTRSLS